jgi:ribosomal protein L11 methyltransferase
VPAAEAELARAVFVELFPQGFEERELAGDIELAGYTDDAGEARVRERFAAVTISEVEPGWEERWREFHRPVRVGPLWIGPPWETPPADALALLVEPARAFGTGSHATTRLCLELLVDLRSGLAGATVLDLGCGSGVLSIAAARLGYGSVLAVDVEPDAIAETRRNARANSVEVEARLADALTAELPACDLVLANIARPTVEALADRLRCRVVVASGYLEAEPVDLPGLRHRTRRTAEGWAADVYERAEPLARSRDSGVTGFPLPCL